MRDALIADLTAQHPLTPTHLVTATVDAVLSSRTKRESEYALSQRAESLAWTVTSALTAGRTGAPMPGLSGTGARSKAVQATVEDAYLYGERMASLDLDRIADRAGVTAVGIDEVEDTDVDVVALVHEVKRLRDIVNRAAAASREWREPTGNPWDWNDYADGESSGRERCANELDGILAGHA